MFVCERGMGGDKMGTGVRAKGAGLRDILVLIVASTNNTSLYTTFRYNIK